MESKKLMIVTVSLGSGGLERMVANIANKYIEKGWKVCVLTLLNPEGNVFVKLDKEVVHYDFKDISSAFASSFEKARKTKKWIRFIRQHICDFRPDCILAMTIKIGSMVVIANKKHKSRVVVREISDPKSKARNQLVNKICFHFCKKADGFIFQTEWEKSCFPKKIQNIGMVIPNPVVLKTNAIEEKRKVIVTMGRLLNYQKRHDVLIKSFALFNKNYPEYKLEIYGEGPDLEFDQKLAGKLNVTNNVVFKGACKNVHELIADASCFVITSDFEGLSNALLEAYLMGIPCITSDWPGAKEVVTDGVDGLVVKRGDINGFANAMECIVRNKDKASLFSKNACNNMKKYDAEIVFESYFKMIEGI